MKIDHIGYAVKRIDRAITSFENLGFVFEPVIDDVDRNVKLAFADKDGYRIELVSPLDRKQESPVDQYVRNSIGTPYHICYEVENIERSIEELQTQRFVVTQEPHEAVAIDGKRVCFLIHGQMGIIELVETR